MPPRREADVEAQIAVGRERGSRLAELYAVHAPRASRLAFVLTRDPDKRRGLLEQIQRQVIEDNILVSVSSPSQQVLHWNYVRDFYPHGVITDSPSEWAYTWLDK